ncbi:MAG: hypothetical protein ABIJ59_10515 [Pseudomonadota bacterium]
MIDFIINPVNAFICFGLAIICFRKEEVSIGQALMLPLQRAALSYKTKFTDVFKIPGIILLISGSLIALLSVILL